MTTFRSAFGFASVLALSGVIACSSSDSGGDVSQDQASADLAGALCDAFNKCAPAIVDLGYASVDDCKARGAKGIAPALKASGTSLTVGQLESCAHDLASTSCSDFLAHTLPQSCHVTPGALSDGAACGADQQCQNGLCRKGSGSECGACSSHGKSGDSCTQDSECDYGLGCPAGIGKCLTYANAGQSCDGNQPCNPTLACKGGVCGTPDGAGQPCETVNGSFSGTCDSSKGYYCHPTSHVCTQIKFAQAGENCGLPSGTACGAAGTCSSPLTGGQCIAAAKDGEACDAAKGIGCTYPAHCVNKICTIDDPATCHS